MTANQGVQFLDVIKGVGNLLLVTSQFDVHDVRRWYDDQRIEAGRDLFIWYRPSTHAPNESTGPVHFGNKVECNFDIHLVTRNFADEAQIDERREVAFWNAYWKIVLAFQNRNLFPSYIQPVATGIWVQPIPSPNIPPLSVGGTMLLKSIPQGNKTQKEEGTLEAVWTLTVPAVLALTIP